MFCGGTFVKNKEINLNLIDTLRNISVEMGTSGDKHEKSLKAFEAACKVLPGGVNSPVRAFGGVDMSPLFIASGRGSKIYDIDGNEYIDYVGSWGPMILGHAHPDIVTAIHAACRKGTSFGAPTLAETQLAEKIISVYNSIEKVRLLCSGTEAVMTAIRLARGFTQPGHNNKNDWLLSWPQRLAAGKGRVGSC